jgi:hypothetical protein
VNVTEAVNARKTIRAFLPDPVDDALIERLGRAQLDELGGAEGLIRTPRLVGDLPLDLRDAVVLSVGDSVVGVIWWGVPIMATIWLLAWLVHETPLRTTSAIQATQARAQQDQEKKDP